METIGNNIGNIASYLKDKYSQYEIGSKIKSGISYVYNKSKPVVDYASNKVVEGAGYLYNKISENIKGTSNNNEIKEENNINIIRLDDSNDVQHSSLVFEKAEGLEEEEKENNIEKQEFPSLSTINKETEKNKNEDNNNNNNSEVSKENNTINIIKIDEE